MLTFNEILAAGGLEPKDVRLVRHQVTDWRLRRHAFDAAVRGDPAFQEYQELQGAPNVVVQFRAARYLAGFVVDPLTKETLLAGVWERLGEREAPRAEGLTGHLPGPDTIAFETRLVDAFDAYRGRLVVEWGAGTRAWVQRADHQNKPVLAIRRQVAEPAFPGLLQFQHSLGEIESIPASWAEVLRNVRGIYLLVRQSSGQQYVGSADGEDGFFGRWCSYADGHGGNVAMKELGAAATEYAVSILETVGSDKSVNDILVREALWKTKLGTRVKGLNRN